MGKNLRSDSNITYKVWRSLRKRHENKNYKNLDLIICKEWEDFDRFVEDMGERPSPEHTLERIDYKRGYFPDNCKWAVWYEQNRNKSTNVYLEYNGKRMVVTDWADELNIPRSTFINRLEKLLTGKAELERRKQKVTDGVSVYTSVKEASERTNISQAAIRKCLCKHNKTAGGRPWSYVN